MNGHSVERNFPASLELRNWREKKRERTLRRFLRLFPKDQRHSIPAVNLTRPSIAAFTSCAIASTISLSWRERSFCSWISSLDNR
ncbi:MAG: hypothetical protein H0X34_00030 [Chthoniobacterales bacterium]|nr:hypothetical protein [Chthoniobacterales bacterium]